MGYIPYGHSKKRTILNGPSYPKDFEGGNKVVSASTLNNGLIAFWKLDEASGLRLDSKGVNHLTDNNTVNQVVGKIGNAASFIRANQESLSILDNADLSVADEDFTFAGWIYPNDNGTQVYFTKETGAEVGGDDFPFRLYQVVGTPLKLQWEVGNNTIFGNVTISVAIPVTTWTFVVCWHDSVGNTINIQINNNAPESSPYAGGSFDSAGAFSFGRQLAGGGIYMDAYLDAWGFWKRLLTAGEITELYNSGNGKEYPF